MRPRQSLRPVWVTVLYMVFLSGIAGAGEVLARAYLAFNTVYDIEMTRYSNELKVTSDAAIGHEHRPLATATLMDVEVSINSDGLRDREYTTTSPHARRLIFLGDSLTFGWGVERSNTFEYMLEERLNQQGDGLVEILNFGIGNYNTSQQVALFAKRGLKYHPNQVVVFYFINDAEPTPTPSRWMFLGHSRLITLYWSRINILLSRYAGRDFISQYGDLYQQGQPGWGAAKAAFVSLKRLCETNGIDLKVVLLPELHDLKNPPFRREYGLVESFLKGEGISVLDLIPYFSSVEDPLSLWVAVDDAHPNAKAHRMIADFSQQFISRRR